MNAFEVYQNYLALKQHFADENYDYFKYHGRVKANVQSFERRKDRFFFDKVAKHSDPTGFLLANIVHNPGAYIRDISYSQEAKKVYLDWLKRKESLSYVFNDEILRLDDNFNNDAFICRNNSHPLILRCYLGKKISLETLCILCSLTGCLKHWNKQLKGDPIYDDVELLVRKYVPFLQFDKEKFKKIIRNNFKET